MKQTTPSQKLTVPQREKKIELIPIKPLKSLRGCLKGKKFTSFEREKDREI